MPRAVLLECLRWQRGGGLGLALGCAVCEAGVMVLEQGPQGVSE